VLLSKGVIHNGPVNSKVPPIESVNQRIVPLPEEALKINEAGPQLESGVTLMIAGLGLIVAVTGVREGVMHPFNKASAKYVLEDDKEGVIKLLPVPMATPPEALAYQLITPVEGIALKVRKSPVQPEAEEVNTTVGIGRIVA